MKVPTNLTELRAVDAREMLSRGHISAVELADACIARVQAVDHAVNAMVARDFDRLRGAARAADARQASGAPLAPLHGLPMAIKDMNDMAGLPTTYGSERHRSNVAFKDDTLVAAMVAAGALPMGKTNNPEWSAGANTRNKVYGTTANPYDLSRNCGGSSGGSAVALACGYAPLATGSDLAGSLRTPAAYCGVVGFRPSPGVVAQEVAPGGLLPLSTSGPMGRCVADCGMMLAAMAGARRNDPYTIVVDGKTPWDPGTFARVGPCDLSRKRVAVTEDFGFARVERNVRDRFQRVMTDLVAFLGRVDTATPDCSGADRIFSVLRGVSYLGTFGRDVAEMPDQFGENVVANVRLAQQFDAQDVADALTAQAAYFQNWQLFFDDHDFLVTPTVAVDARDWHEMYPADIDGVPTDTYYHWLALAYAVTIAGHPAITLPCGTDGNGVPFGLQIIGRRYDEGGVLAFAQALEAVIAGLDVFAPQPPDISALTDAPALREAEGFWPQSLT